MPEFIINNWISIAGAIIGLTYLYLEYKAKVWMWAVSIIMAAFYVFIYYKATLYASMGIYIYFFFASIYGWIMWITRNRDVETGDEIITSVSKKYIIPVLGSVLLISVFIYLVLYHFSVNPFFITAGDSFATSLNIVALWMISRKWVEQWLLLIPANLTSSALLFYQGDIMSGTLFFVYFIVSILGYFRWKKISALMIVVKNN